MKRLGIYSFYDPDGIVDAGDLLYLSAVAEQLDCLVIVVNGALTEKAREQLAQYASMVIYRENRGFDGGAFREVLLKHLSREVWRTVDELVLFNNTVFGPVYPLKPLFEQYSDKPIDFWGMTFWKGDDYSWSDHIQSYFLVFKKPAIQSDAFWAFWREMQTNFTDENYLIAHYEMRLTAYLAERGFHYDVISKKRIFEEPLQTVFDGVPVLKKKFFRMHGFGIGPETYEKIFQVLRSRNLKLVDAIFSYMKRYRFQWRTDIAREALKSDVHRELKWTNQEILAALRPYQRVYFYGRTMRTYFLMANIQEKERFIVESDSFVHESYQGDLAILHLSELPAHVGDDALMVVFLRKKNAASLRKKLESIFQHIIYLCDEREK